MKRILTFSLIFLGCQQAWATTTPTTDLPYHKLYVSMGAGAVIPTISGDNDVDAGAGWPYDHYSHHSISQEPLFKLEGGYSWFIPRRWLPIVSLGLSSQFVYPMTLKGSVDQYSLPDFKNYQYKYNIQLLDLLGTLKINLVSWYQLMPYVKLGAGFVNYRVSNYNETAVTGVTPRVSPGFQSDNSYNFAYTTDIGLEYTLQSNLSVFLEYDYSDFGTIKTGEGANTATLTGTNYANESLQNKLTMNTVLAGITLYFN